MAAFDELNKLETAAALCAVRAVMDSMPAANREVAAIAASVGVDPLTNAERKLANNLDKFNEEETDGRK